GEGGEGQCGGGDEVVHGVLLKMDEVEDDTDRRFACCCFASDLLVNSQGMAGRLQRDEDFLKKYFSRLL
ncbi:hypothetical protein ABTF76_20130, partial [Acinetobacter baumannii]